MADKDCREFPCLTEGDTANLQMSWHAELASGATISGASASMVGTGSSDITLGTVSASTESLIISGATVSAGRAVTFSITGQTWPNKYKVRVKSTTSDSQTLTRFCRFSTAPSS